MALKILILTPRIPFPLRDGGSIAMNQTIEGYLGQGCEVSLLSMNTSRHWVEESTLPEMYQRLAKFNTVYVKTNVNPLSAFLNLFTDKSYNVARFINREFEKVLISMLQSEQYDYIQFESIYTSPYLKTVRKYNEAKCFCRVHNIEYLIWQRLSDHETSFLKRKYLELLTNRLKAYELDVLRKFDLLLPISKKEEVYFVENKLNHCYYLPFGVDGSKTLPEVVQETQSCFHIGSMDWAPNIEGVQWFLQHVWNVVQPQLNDVALYLAGKNMPPALRSKASANLHIVGEVDDVTVFSLEKNIMIVPLLSGAGIRIKILEAMALGKTIITTTIGAEGIGATHPSNILIANTVDEFISALHFCFEEIGEAKQIGRNARAFVLANYLKDKIYSDLTNYLQRAL
jgi:glycosyltransferase involved in cell wall biosynthesis